MKLFLKIFTISIFSLLLSIKSNAANKKGGTKPEKPVNSETPESDTTIKNNIVIFKIIPTTQSTQNNNNGDLKKAGKFVRTSTSPHSSIDDILYKKRGI